MDIGKAAGMNAVNASPSNKLGVATNKVDTSAQRALAGINNTASDGIGKALPRRPSGHTPPPPPPPPKGHISVPVNSNTAMDGAAAMDSSTISKDASAKEGVLTNMNKLSKELK